MKLTLIEQISCIADILVSKNLTIGTAESCTGGAIGKAITLINGSSAYYAGGVIAYAENVKTSVLGVKEEVISKNGVVSEAVVISMAEGCINTIGVDIGIATSGIAGPTGGTDKTPVGTVCIAIVGPDFSHSWTEHFTGERNDVVEGAVEKSLSYLLKSIK